MSTQNQSLPAFKEWLNAREIAELGLPDMPHSERGIGLYMRRIVSAGSRFVRKNNGRGGGVHYHCSLLPPFALEAYERPYRIGRNWKPPVGTDEIMRRGWLTAGDIAKLRLPGLPETSRAAATYLRGLDLPGTAFRPRMGTKPGIEYEIEHCLPWEALRAFKSKGMEFATPEEPALTVWFSAQELADLHLPGLPRHRSSIARKLNADPMLQEMHLRRQRNGKGGGFQYHLSCLPLEAVISYRQTHHVGR